RLLHRADREPADRDRLGRSQRRAPGRNPCMSTNTESLGKVVGANLRRIRNEREATLEEVSRAVRECGVEWSVSRVTAIQRGTRDPQLATILLLANALDCTVADLLETD